MIRSSVPEEPTGETDCSTYVLSQDNKIKFSFAPKKDRKYICISALAYMKMSYQKSSVREFN